MLVTTLTVFVFAAAVIAAAPPIKFCNKKAQALPYGWTAGQEIGKLQQQSMSLISDVNLDLVCSGTIVVLNDCQFMVKDFTFTDPNTTAWFAGYANDPNTGVRFAAENVGVSKGGDSPIYNLVAVVGAAYAWTSIDQLRLFDTANQQLIAIANLDVSGSPHSSGNSSGSAGSTSSLSNFGSSPASLPPITNAASAVPTNGNNNNGASTQKIAITTDHGSSPGAKSEAFECVVYGLNMLMAAVFLI
ncbi:UNVERIFIED_CONTAM: hypothetical protein HDU68_007199 [Siphonaria sp. JEL0065]|nr:hypothetical protein HDU68_007199 [Siphonaria sp. JEL0065]